MAKSLHRQVVLPWEQVLKISFNSIKTRFFRSLITTLTLALAVSFVAYIWSGYDILNALWPNAAPSLREHIQAIGYEPSAGQFGSGPKDRWLAILSLLVCVVGTVNAQLMAVTERFREIGTFKCLGALNSFVVRIFVLEAIYQGLLGGALGSLVGIVVAILSLAVKLGLIVFTTLPVINLLATLGWTAGLSVVLSLLGVIYPALVAARMQPAVALRAEE